MSTLDNNRNVQTYFLVLLDTPTSEAMLNSLELPADSFLE